MDGVHSARGSLTFFATQPSAAFTLVTPRGITFETLVLITLDSSELTNGFTKESKAGF